VTRELLVLETLADMTFTTRPAVAFYPGSYMVGDHSNWWGPNTSALVGMLSEFGFRRIEVISRTDPVHRVRRAVANAANVVHSRLVRSRTSLPIGYLATDRLIVHAYR
jgi:hypothetical protein